MASVGDRVHIASTKVGQAPREGVVTSVVGQLLRVRWSTGEESTIVPGPGSVVVTGHVKATPRKQAPSPAKAPKKARGAKKT